MGESALPLQGQVAVVTGASRGIGHSIAMKLASEGADLVLSARGVEGVEAVAAAVREENPDRRVLPLGCDVSDWDSVSALVDRTLEEFERLDFLVNNAGITRDNLVLRMKQEEWDAVIATNLTGVFNTCRLVARQMLRQRSGRIINIASTSGHRGRADATAYSAAKGGVLNLTRSLAIQMSPYGVRVNSITPNRVGSPVGQETIPQTGREVSNLVGRQGMPPDIAAAAVFLASDEADFIAAADLLVDGGSLAGGMPFSPPSPAAR